MMSRAALTWITRLYAAFTVLSGLIWILTFTDAVTAIPEPVVFAPLLFGLPGFVQFMLLIRNVVRQETVPSGGPSRIWAFVVWLVLLPVGMFTLPSQDSSYAIGSGGAELAAAARWLCFPGFWLCYTTFVWHWALLGAYLAQDQRLHDSPSGSGN